MKKEKVTWIIKNECVHFSDMNFTKFEKFEEKCKYLINNETDKFYSVEYRVDGNLIDSGLITDYFNKLTTISTIK